MADRPQTDRDWKTEATAWRARAEHLQATVDRLRSLAVAGESAGFLAHELNNLFTPVVGYCHAALDERLDADDAVKTKALRKALAAAERVGEVSRAILGLAGSVGGEAMDEDADVEESVRAALLVLGAERWGREGIDVKVDVPRGTLARARGGVVQQVVMNLVLNARRAMVGRRGVLEVVAREVGGVVRMEVRDEGEGMNAEVMGCALGITKCDDTEAGDQHLVDVQELARSGSINGQARWGVRVRKIGKGQIAKEPNRKVGDDEARARVVARLRGAKIDASMSPIKIWDAGEVAAEMRGAENERRNSDSGSRAARGGEIGVGTVVGATDNDAESRGPLIRPRKADDASRAAQLPAFVRSTPESTADTLSCIAGEGGRPIGDAVPLKAGTGLGLALCLELVGRVGGKMTARSEVGVGTVVVVEWPRAGATARVAA